MNFAFPSAFWWLGLAVPIVILYILKIRLRRVPVSTTLFWRQIFEEKQPRSIWQHLRHLISLLLQLAFLLLLVLALAEPFFRWEILAARRVVLVIDNSASMNATDRGSTRLEKAKERGQRILNGLRFRDEIAIVAAGTQPQVLCGLTGHQRTLHKTLDAVSPTDGPTRVADAVALGRRLLADQSNGKVIVLSDGCFEGADELADAPDVEFVGVGQKSGNVGITRFQVRRSLIDPIGYEVLAEVFNYSDEPAEFRFEIELNGDAIEVVPLKLASGESWTKVYEKASPTGGILLGKLDRADALMTDNQAWAILPHREMQPVMLVSENNLFLEMVFKANPLVHLSVSSELPNSRPAGALTIFHRKVPNPLPAGAVLVIDPAGPCELWDVGDTLLNPIVTKQDKDSPLMAYVKLDNVIMPEARKLTLKGSPQVLASSINGEPLYAAYERPEGKVVVLTVNLDQGDLPLRTAFPIMATNALSWFTGNKGELRESLATGGVTDVEVPLTPPVEGAEAWLRAPGGHLRKLPSNVTKTTVGPMDECGIWSLVWKLPKADTKTEPVTFQEFACNLANRSESDIRPPENLVAKPDETLTASFGGRPLWFYLLAVAGMLTAVEWCLYQRRTIS